MPPFRAWESIKADAPKYGDFFELRGDGDNWGIFYKGSNSKLTDPRFGKVCIGKSDADVKKALRIKVKNLMTSDHGVIDIYKHVLGFKTEFGAQLGKVEALLNKHSERGGRDDLLKDKGVPEELAIITPPITMMDTPFDWNPMFPSTTWTTKSMIEYAKNIDDWKIYGKLYAKGIALYPRIVKMKLIGHRPAQGTFFDNEAAVFSITFEHPFTKEEVKLDIDERHMWQDPSYHEIYKKIGNTLQTQQSEIFKMHSSYKKLKKE